MSRARRVSSACRATTVPAVCRPAPVRLATHAAATAFVATASRAQGSALATRTPREVRGRGRLATFARLVGTASTAPLGARAPARAATARATMVYSEPVSALATAAGLAPPATFATRRQSQTAHRARTRAVVTARASLRIPVSPETACATPSTPPSTAASDAPTSAAALVSASTERRATARAPARLDFRSRRATAATTGGGPPTALSHVIAAATASAAARTAPASATMAMWERDVKAAVAQALTG